MHAATIYLGTAIGGVTLTGSVVAFAKLHGIVKGTPLALSNRDQLNKIGAALTGAGLLTFIAVPASSVGAVALGTGS